MALDRQLMFAAQQLLGRDPTAQELNDPAFMQRLVQAADQGNANDAGMRQNLDWIDQQMAPAAADLPAKNAKPASLNTRTSSSGKGDRLDVQEAPLPPSRPNDVGLPRTAPPAESAPSAGQSSGNAASSGGAKGTRESVGSFPRGVAAQRADNAPSDAPAVEGTSWLDEVLSGTGPTPIQNAVKGFFKGDKAEAAAVPSPDDTTPRKGNESERVASEKTPAGRAMVDMENGMDRSTWDENAPVNNTNWRDAVQGVYENPPPTTAVRKLGQAMVQSNVPDDVSAKLQQAGLDPTSLTYGDKLRMQTMGVDRWIAEQVDQLQRNMKRPSNKKASAAAP